MSKEKELKRKIHVHYSRLVAIRNGMIPISPTVKPEAGKEAKATPHFSDQFIVTGNLAKGFENYDKKEKEPEPARAEYYALNAWHYIGSDSGRYQKQNLYKDNIYGKKGEVLDGLECFKFYSDDFHVNFYKNYRCRDMVTDGLDEEIQQLRKEKTKYKRSSKEYVELQAKVNYLCNILYFGKIQLEKAAKNNKKVPISQKLTKWIAAESLQKKSNKHLKAYRRRAATVKKKKEEQVLVLKDAIENAPQIFPYPWQAHHILPENAFYCGVLPDKIIQLILQHTRYDINYGSNILFLPRYKKDCHFHRLPFHFGSHPEYDQYVIEEFKMLIKKHEELECESISGRSFEDKLYAIENKVFRYITIVIGPGITINTYIQ